MSTYTPDCWEIVVITSPEHGKIHKVLGGWYGGFGGSNSWKLSSGIESVVERDGYYELPQSSGSVYHCYKGSRKLNSLTASILASLKEQLTESRPDCTVELFADDITSLDLTS